MDLGSAKSRRTKTGRARGQGRLESGDESPVARRGAHAAMALIGGGPGTLHHETPPDEGTRVELRAGAVLRIELVLDERTLREVGRAIATAYDAILSLAPEGVAGDGGPGPLQAARAALESGRPEGEERRPVAHDPRRSDVIVTGDLRIDLGAHEVWRGGRRMPLRPKEFALLRALLRANGSAVTRKCLLHEVWGYTEGVFSRTLDTHVRSLRRKLEDDPAAPRHLLTVRTVGFRFAR